MSVPQYVDQLGEATRHGWGFLAAYGSAWLACAVVWRTTTPRTAGYVTLFQGTVALPLALALTELAPGPPRPTLPGMDLVAVLLASGQLLAIPMMAVLVARGHPSWVPPVMATVVAVHFAPYSWLYGTPLYLVGGAVISVAVAVHLATALRPLPGRPTGAQPDPGPTAAWRTCLTTGTVLLAGAAVTWLL